MSKEAIRIALPELPADREGLQCPPPTLGPYRLLTQRRRHYQAHTLSSSTFTMDTSSDATIMGRFWGHSGVAAAPHQRSGEGSIMMKPQPLPRAQMVYNLKPWGWER
jgi:hypothetical protein